MALRRPPIRKGADYRIYVAGVPGHLTIRHAAESVEALFAEARAGMCLSAEAAETDGSTRRVLIPFDKIAIIAEASRGASDIAFLAPSSRTIS